MTDKPQRASLSDMLNYEPDRYITDDEVRLLQSTFRGNKKLINLLRKLLIPTMSDPDLPIEEVGADVYFSKREWAQIPADEAKILMVARQDAIQFIVGGLIKLNIIANDKVESPLDAELRRGKDSNK